MTLTDLLNEAKQLNLQEQVQLAPQLMQWIEIKLNEETASTGKKKIRKPGLNRGCFLISDEFNDPLSDDFWLGNL